MRNYVFKGLGAVLLSFCLVGTAEAARQGQWLDVGLMVVVIISVASYVLSPTPGPKVPGARTVSDRTGDSAAGDHAAGDVPDHASPRDEEGKAPRPH